MKTAAFYNALITLHLIGLVTVLPACSTGNPSSPPQLPAEFVDIQDYFQAANMAVAVDARYFGSDNFVGAPVDGYKAEKVFITRQAAEGLLQVQNHLMAQGLALKIFDAYRPQKAVDHFVRWAQDLEDVRMKQKYYPRVQKQHLFRDGYIAARSGHSRGSTVDLTVVRLTDGGELDMGTSWDFFDPLSWPSSSEVNAAQRTNRKLLSDAMIGAGFRPLAEEWWHFTLAIEPFPERYFDFDIE
jgi:D-alanyl-D-alanine dipeptidase